MTSAHEYPPREAGCFDLGGCSISEVNKPCNGVTGSVCFHFISYILLLRNTTTEQVVCIEIVEGSLCV